MGGASLWWLGRRPRPFAMTSPSAGARVGPASSRFVIWQSRRLILGSFCRSWATIPVRPSKVRKDSKGLTSKMDSATLEAEQAEIQEDILKLQLHSTPLNLAWDSQDEEEEEDDDGETILLPVPESTDSNPPMSSGIIDIRAPSSLSNVTTLTAVEESDEEYEDEEEEIDLSKDLEPTGENILKLNLAYQEVIQMQLHFVEELLQQNHQKQEETKEEFSSESGPNKKAKHHPAVNFKINTFSHNHFHQMKSAPPHSDVLRRMSEVGEIFEHIPFSNLPWKKAEEEKLTKGIERDRLRVLTEPLMSQLEYLQEKYTKSDDPEISKRIKEVEGKMKNIKEKKFADLVGDRDVEHDWEAISNIDMEGTRSSAECWLRWKNRLHPSINHKNWSKKEDADMRRIAIKHSYRNWTKIAEELGTGRTALECAQKCQKGSHDHKMQPWTPEEDERLKMLVEKSRVGNIIPFTYVALHMGNRTGTQVCHRWMRSVNPCYKKAKWTPEEDISLLKAIVKYGPKWSVIRDSGLVPGRNDAQCRERWENCLRNVNRDPWSEKEDKVILQLVESEGVGKWSTIAQALNRRTDNQVFHRWKYITKMKEKGCEIRYRKKGPRTMVDGLTEVRQRLIKIIESQSQKKLIEDADHSGTGLTQTQLLSLEQEQTSPVTSKKLLPLPYRQIIHKHTRTRSRRWLQEKFAKRIESAKSSEEIISLYKELSEELHKGTMGNKLKLEELNSDDDTRLAHSVICSKFRPFERLSLKDGTNINGIRNQVYRTATTFEAKDIFVHYTKAMNINAGRTLLAIQKTLYKDQDQSTAAATEECANKNAQNFIRNHTLALCAPNQGTVPAFQRLIKDKERRVRNAKYMLVEQKQTKKDSQIKASDVGDKGNEPTNPYARLYNGRKYSPESLIKNIQKMPEHKLLRSRFVSLFAWPAVLSTLVPYKRSGPFRVLKPVVRVRMKRKSDNGPEDEPPKKLSKV